MLTTTDERVEVVYTGLLTAACKEPNAELDGGWRWVPKGKARCKAHTVVVSVRGLSGRELTKAGLADQDDTSARVDAVYDALGQCAYVTGGKLQSLEQLSWGAAFALWGYAAALSRGEDYEEIYQRNLRKLRGDESDDDAPSEDD